MKTLVLAVIALGLTGCATDAAVIRITEYKAGTFVAAVSGQGVSVTQSGKSEAFARVEILYQGERGTVVVSSDPGAEHAVPD